MREDPLDHRMGLDEGNQVADARACRAVASCPAPAGFDVLGCPRCGGRFRLIALIDNPRVVQRILAHLRLPCEVPGALPPRAPPLPLDRAVGWVDDDTPAG
jgi:hypothetical protein